MIDIFIAKKGNQASFATSLLQVRQVKEATEAKMQRMNF